MERRVTGNCHARCEAGEKLEIVSKAYLSLFGVIPNFEKLIATIRSREISATVILQTKSQLKDIYKEAAETIIGNCDSEVFLGGKEVGTLESITKMLGKQTIDSYNTSKAKSGGSTSYQKMGRELMSVDEVAVMDNRKCIVQIRGERPFFSDKYDTSKHRHWALLADFDASRYLDPEAFVIAQRKQTEQATAIEEPVMQKKKTTTKAMDAQGYVMLNQLKETLI